MGRMPKNGFRISAGVATIPDRGHLLGGVVKRILPQVDILYIRFNGYDSVPDEYNNNKKIITMLDKSNSLRDIGKFSGIYRGARGYFFSLDDDLSYPENYVSYLIDKIEQYDRKYIVGLHGVIFRPRFSRFYHDRKVYSFCRKAGKDKRVHVLGTGTAAFHTKTFRPKLRDLKRVRGVDLPFAVAAKNANVGMMMVKRDVGWLRQGGKVKTAMWLDTLRSRKLAEELENYIKANKPWPKLK